MSYLNELLIEQRVADRRRVSESSRRVAAVGGSRSWRRTARAAAARALVRCGERLAPPAATPVTR